MLVSRKMIPRAHWNLFRNICSYQGAGGLQPGCGFSEPPWGI